MYGALILIKRPKTGKYEAEFGTGLLDSFGDSAESDSNSSIKPTLVLNGDLVEGWATVDAENEELARASTTQWLVRNQKSL